MKIDIYRSATNSGKYLSVPADTDVTKVSFPADLEQVGNVIFRLPLKYDTPWPVSLLVIVAVVVVSGVILERRVRGVEVVA